MTTTASRLRAHADALDHGVVSHERLKAMALDVREGADLLDDVDSLFRSFDDGRMGSAAWRQMKREILARLRGETT